MDPTGYGIWTSGRATRIGSGPCTTCIVDEEAISAVPANRPNATQHSVVNVGGDTGQPALGQQTQSVVDEWASFSFRHPHFLASASHPTCSSFVISWWQSRVSAIAPLDVWGVWVRNQGSHEEKISTRVRVFKPIDTTSRTPAKPLAAPSFAAAHSCRDAFRGAASHQFSCSSDLHVGSRSRIPW